MVEFICDSMNVLPKSTGADMNAGNFPPQKGSLNFLKSMCRMFVNSNNAKKKGKVCGDCKSSQKNSIAVCALHFK